MVVTAAGVTGDIDYLEVVTWRQVGKVGARFAILNGNAQHSESLSLFQSGLQHCFVSPGNGNAFSHSRGNHSIFLFIRGQCYKASRCDEKTQT